MEKSLTTKKKSDSKENIEERTTVEEIENGYLIIRTKEGTNNKGEWFHKQKKSYSKENPLADVEKKLADNF